MSSSNETRKPAGRPSLLSAEQQNALENQAVAPEVLEPQVAETPRRKIFLWMAAGIGIGVVAVAAVLAVVMFSEEELPAAKMAAVPAPVSAPAPVKAPDPAPAASAADASPLAALTAETPATAAIIDEAPPPLEAKPKESLKHMLEQGAAPAAKAAPKPAKEKPAKPAAKSISKAAPEEDNDVELLAALVAHTKYEASGNFHMTLPKALEQCKRQGEQDAARCRIRVCEGRWKKDECRAFNRSKLEKIANGA